MIRYIPFLKAKRGELTAIGELSHEVKQGICPLFDFPRNNDDYTPEAFVSKTTQITSGLSRHWGDNAEFYFDDADVAQDLEINNEHQYAFVLRSLRELQAIPVVSLGRTLHNDSVVNLKREGIISSSTVAFRALQDDFEDFELTRDDIEDDLDNVFDEFETIDLILDCRLCVNMGVSETAQQIATFARRFSRAYDKVRRIIITGSCIPPSIRDTVNTDGAAIVPRRELEIIAEARDLVDFEIITGDYATVSPFFADMNISPLLFQRVTAPKLIYSFDNCHYVSRGTSLASGGQDQYVGLTNTLCNKAFFRGPGYSSGEAYFDEKRRRIGNGATNGTVVKPSVVAHITYMALDASF